MIGSRNTVSHALHWYTAASGASHTVSTMRRRVPSQPNGQSTSATGAFSDQSGNACEQVGGALDGHRRAVAQRGADCLEHSESAEVVVGRRDQVRAGRDGFAEID